MTASRASGRIELPALWLVLALLVGTWPASNVYAADDYFTGQALQTGNVSEQTLISGALAHVLVKLTGRADLVDLPAVQPLLADAQKLLVGFSYREQRAPGNVFDDADRYLLASFDQRMVQERLRQAGIALWTLERPALLLWLGIEENGERRMLAGDEEVLRYQMQQQADYRGLPLLLPLQDQTDYALVQAESIWGGFYEDALLAAERYASDQTVIATAARVGFADRALWQVRWRLHNQYGLETFTSNGSELASALSDGIDQLAELSARQSAVNLIADAAQLVIARLPQVIGPQQFGRAWQALAGLSQVESVHLLQAGDEGIDLNLQMRADVSWLRQAIDFSDELWLLEPGQNDLQSAVGLDRTRIPIIILP